MMRHLKLLLIITVAIVLLDACSPAEGNFAGSEYMPDMAHSIAYESNVFTYYYYNNWDSASTIKRKALSNPRLPVAGTIPRGYAGVFYAADADAQASMMDVLHGKNSLNAISVPVNGNVPYYYKDTPEERLRATAEIIANPFPITAKGLEKGKELYNIYCGICHGEKADGQGYLVSESNPNAKYPAQPANFLDSAFVNSNNGRFYHAIMYGLNTMGAYADKLSYEERWQVIHYIRSLQAQEKKLAYNDKTNTLNPLMGIPAASVKVAAKPASDAVAPPAENDASTGQSHSDSGSGHQSSGSHK